VTASHCGHDTQPATTLRQVSKEKVPVAEAELAPPEEQDEIDLKGKSLSELRAIALAAATTPKAPSKESQRTYYVRSAKVKAYVLQRANGCCEACKKAAEVLVPGRKKRIPLLGVIVVHRRSGFEAGRALRRSACKRRLAVDGTGAA
jgi:hypothetical protein